MRSCPALFIGLLVPFLAAAQGLPEQPNDIGYSSPAAALSAVRSKPGVVITEKDGWIVLEDRSENALWTIAKPGNPAYPSAIKRYVANKELHMKVLCEASKQACDSMVMQFQDLNRQIVKSLQ
jgi:hypothetical protein